MNLNEVIVVVCWKMEQYYENVEFEQYRPLIVPLGTHESDVRKLVEHVYGDDAEFEMYAFDPSVPASTVQFRNLNFAGGKTANVIVISDTTNKLAPVCWAGAGDIGSLLVDAKTRYPAPRYSVEVSSVTSVSPTDGSLQYSTMDRRGGS